MWRSPRRAHRVALAVAALSQPTRRDGSSTHWATRSMRSAALVEAEEAGLLTTERDRIRFTHPLLASVVYRSASPERRRRLHERLASVVADEEERARHLALSATTPDEAGRGRARARRRPAARRGHTSAAAELFAASRRLTPTERGRPDAAGARRGVRPARRRRRRRCTGTGRARGDSPVAALRGAALHLLGRRVDQRQRRPAEGLLRGGARGSTRRSRTRGARLPEARQLRDARTDARGRPRAGGDGLAEPRTPSCSRSRRSPSTASGPRSRSGMVRAGTCSKAGAGSRRRRARRAEDAARADLLLVGRRLRPRAGALRGRGGVVSRARRGSLARGAARSPFDDRAAGGTVGHRAERSIEEACDALAQHFDKPGPWGAAFRIRRSHRRPRRPDRARARDDPPLHREGRAGGARSSGRCSAGRRSPSSTSSTAITGRSTRR